MSKTTIDPQKDRDDLRKALEAVKEHGANEVTMYNVIRESKKALAWGQGMTWDEVSIMLSDVFKENSEMP